MVEKLKRNVDLYNSTFLDVHKWCETALRKRGVDLTLKETEETLNLFFKSDKDGGIIIEEVNEFFDIGASNDDRLDALADLTYVFHNVSYTFGLPLHLYSIDFNSDPSTVYADNKGKLNFVVDTMDTIRHMLKYSNLGYVNFNSSTLLELTNMCININEQLMRIWAVYGDVIYPKFRQVSASNWTKFTKSQETAKLSVEAYKNGTHKFYKKGAVDAKYIKNGEYYVILKHDNKVFKSLLDYKEPNEFNFKN